MTVYDWLCNNPPYVTLAILISILVIIVVIVKHLPEIINATTKLLKILKESNITILIGKREKTTNERNDDDST